MGRVRVASFNVWGIDAKDVTQAVDGAVGQVGPSQPGIVGIGFQEVWFRHQLRPILERWVGGGDTVSRYVDLECRYSARVPGWKCLVPTAGSAGIPGIRELELGSGLVLCVKGAIKDAFFVRFRGGYVPDSFAHKGIIAAYVAPPDSRPRAIVNTHFHDFSNDDYGGARQNHLEQLASVIKYIDVYWRVPTIVVGDFNIDSRIAYRAGDPTVERVLYSRLVSIGKPVGSSWFDVNARCNALVPLPTQSDADGAIDIHLVSDGKPEDGLAFDRFRFDSGGVAFSDHQMVTTSWSET